jgi:hypothetical protein
MSKEFPTMNLQHSHFPSNAFLGIVKKELKTSLGKYKRKPKANTVPENIQQPVHRGKNCVDINT